MASNSSNPTSIAEFRQWLSQEIAALEQLEVAPDLEEAIAYAGATVNVAKNIAAQLSLSRVVRICRKVGSRSSLFDAHETLSNCLDELAEDRPLRPIEAAEILKVSERRIYKLCRRKKLQHTKYPLRVDRASLMEYLKTRPS